MYRVCEGKYINNVKDGDKFRMFYSGEILPSDYIPPSDYIGVNKIIEKIEIKEEKKEKKKEALNG